MSHGTSPVLFYRSVFVLFGAHGWMYLTEVFVSTLAMENDERIVADDVDGCLEKVFPS